MRYIGKLYGKVGNKYFDTGKTANEFDCLELEVIKLQQTIKDMELKHEAERQEDIKNIKILKELLK